ncbi:DUF2922 domain-containing protein [Latilactobacillus sakei]
MKELNLEFKTSVNKNKTLRLRQVNESLTPEVVKATMIKIADANLFEKDDIQLYKTPVATKYVERIETPIFSDK